MDTLFYVLPALGIGFLLGRIGRDRAVSFQNDGEMLLSSSIQEHFASPEYHLMNHITLPFNGGTTQIDHILVSRFGIFVIETKHYTGWIFASASHRTWTQVLFKRKFKFQNPLLQNVRHVLAVRHVLDYLSPDTIKPIVVFTGDAVFKTEPPDDVFTVAGLVDHLRSFTVEVLSLDRVHWCVGRLEAARLAITGQTDVEHVQNLNRWHGAAE
jgi:Nuclease-related domain